MKRKAIWDYIENGGWALIALILVFLVGGFADRAFGRELVRFESTASGPLLAIKDVGANGQQIKVQATFRIGAFGGLQGRHLVFGVGDLTRYFESGLGPIGDGFIVGEMNGCGDPGQVSGLLESWRWPNPSTNHTDTCYTGLKADRDYTVNIWVSANQTVRYQLIDGTRVLSEVVRYMRPAPAHARGVFVFGASSDTPFELKSFLVTEENDPVPMPKR